jgi:hypothetical protein
MKFNAAIGPTPGYLHEALARFVLRHQLDDETGAGASTPYTAPPGHSTASISSLTGASPASASRTA